MNFLASLCSMPSCCDSPKGESPYTMPKFTALARRRCSALIFREVGQQPQLNLRVVSREQNTSGLGNERGANLASQLRANGNILQVWIDGREPARRRSRLVERGMETLGSGIQQQR